MKFRGPPFWLFCDVICWIGVLASYCGFARSVAAATGRMLAGKRRSLEPDEFGILAGLLSIAEAWAVFALTRRAFRMAGLDAWTVRFPDFSPPQTSGRSSPACASCSGA